MEADPESDGSRAGRATPSPSRAAFLSFAWPGLGQWYAGYRLRAFVHAVPAAFVAGGLLALASGGPEAMVGRLLVPGIALAVLAAIVVLGTWRLVSLLDAWWLARMEDDAIVVERRRRWARGGFLVALAAITIVSHAFPAYWAVAFYRAGSSIFQPPQTGGVRPGDEPAPETPAPGTTREPGAVPGATASPILEDRRINVLLVGIDSTPNRPAEHRFTDTLIVASFDRDQRLVRLVSVPRGVVRFPLYTGGIHEGKLNALMHEAELDPASHPDGPMGTLVNEVSFLLGVEIDYYASVDVPGFQQLVDSVGGVDIVLDEPIADPFYQYSPEQTGFFLDAGPHHLDGAMAVAFVRSRKGPGRGEARSLRQQQLLLALRQRLRDPAIIARIPEVLDATAATVRTDLPAGRPPEMLAPAPETHDPRGEHPRPAADREL